MATMAGSAPVATVEKIGEHSREYKVSVPPSPPRSWDAWLDRHGKRVAWEGLACCLVFELWLSRFSPWTSPALVFAIVVLVVRHARRSRVQEESLLVMQELGVQLTTRTRGGKEVIRFLDKADIKTVVLNEGIQKCTVNFYLAFVMRDADKLVIAFPNLRPRLPGLKQAFLGTRAILFAETEEPAELSDTEPSGFIPQLNSSDDSTGADGADGAAAAGGLPMHSGAGDGASVDALGIDLVRSISGERVGSAAGRRGDDGNESDSAFSVRRRRERLRQRMGRASRTPRPAASTTEGGAH